MLMITGFVMRLLKIAGASLFQTFGSLLLMVFYLVFSFFLLNDISFRGMFKKASYVGIGGGNITLGILSGFAFSNVVSAILFKTMAWHGAGTVLFVSILPLLMLTVAAVISFMNRKTGFRKQLLIRCMIYTIVLLVVGLLPEHIFLAMRPGFSG